MASSRLSPLSCVQRLPLEIEQFGQFFVAAIGFFDLLGQLALVAFDHLLLAAELVGLLLERCPAACRAGVRVRAALGGAWPSSRSPSAFCWMAISLISSSASLRRLALSRSAPRDDFARLAFGILAPQPIEQLGPHESQDRHDGDQHDDVAHGNFHGIPSVFGITRVRQRARALSKRGRLQLAGERKKLSRTARGTARHNLAKVAASTVVDDRADR